MELRGKQVLVFGTGLSGIGASDLLTKLGAKVILYDENISLNLKDVNMRLEEVLGINHEVEIATGELPETMFHSLHLVVMSPGVPTDLPLVLEFKSRGILIWGEVELAYRYAQGRLIAITGTNGKTTTTALLGEIMKAHNPHTYVVGNIGIPYTSLAFDMEEDAITVAEVSSFQLETVDIFHPNVSAILNISPDHLDRHHTMEAYIETKFAVAKNQTEEDICVLNYEDEITREFKERTKASVIYFSSKRKLLEGVFYSDKRIYYKEVCICDVDELHLVGIHNYENVMAAVACAVAMSVPTDIIQKAVKAFTGVAHRIEYVAELDGVTFYNDSKGTNPDAAIKGIQAMNRPTILIGGGYDKDASYEEWIESFAGNVKKLVLLGATQKRIAEAAKRVGFTEVKFVDTLEEAVTFCKEIAKPGDAVLLSPACASWGMFQNFEARGERFKELVLEI